MKKIALLALVAFVVIVAAAVAAAPTASIEDVTQTSMRLTKLDCGTNWNVRIRRIRADGTYGATQTLPPTRTLACDPTPPPPPPPDPTPTGTEPAPIAGQGYHEVFRDDFNTLDRSIWDDHIWYDEAPHADWTGVQTASNGVLTLRSSRNYLCACWSRTNYPDSTITTQTSGKTFQYGYFETRMKWPAGDGSWPGFWLYSYQHAIDDQQCTTQAGEIDVMEGQGSEPNAWYGTVHSNTNGCPPADDQNGNNWQDAGVDLTQGFHTYAVKWTPTDVTWYLDGKETHSASTYPTDNQPMFLLLQEWIGGWTTDPDVTTPDNLDNQIDYVSVWQQ